MNDPSVIDRVKRTFPSGFSTVTTASRSANVIAEATMLIRCPAVPLKVSAAFCPGTEVVMVTDGPPGVISAVGSGGTSARVRSTSPDSPVNGSTRRLYVPARGSRTASMNLPAVIPNDAWTSRPSGP